MAEGATAALTAADSATAGSIIRWYQCDFDYDGVTFTLDTARSAALDAVFSAAGVDGIDNGSARALAVRVYD